MKRAPEILGEKMDALGAFIGDTVKTYARDKLSSSGVEFSKEDKVLIAGELFAVAHRLLLTRLQLSGFNWIVLENICEELKLGAYKDKDST